MSTDAAVKRVLVAGATGRLGVMVDVLLDHGHRVRAMTRDPGSAAAERLRGKGAEVVAGDFDDPTSLELAARKVDAVFATGTAHQAGLEGELRHAHNLLAAVAAARVPHLVYSSGDGADANSPLPLFRVKHRVEESVRSLPLAYTILAPVYFMENLFNPWNLPALGNGVYPSPISVGVPLQQVALSDLAELGALVIERPDEFAGERIPIASDAVTAAQAADALSRVTARRFEAEPAAAAEIGPGLRALFGWLEHRGHHVDIQALRRRFPEVGWHSYEQWLREQRPRLSALCPHERAGVR